MPKNKPLDIELTLDDYYLVCDINSKNVMEGSESNVAIAGAVTAYARIHMSQFKPSGWLNKFLFYTDTDSLICSEKLPSRLVGNQLGQMKLEHIIKDGVFLAPKVYGFITSFAFFIYIINKKKKGDGDIPSVRR